MLKTLGDHLRKRRLDLALLQRETAEKLGANDMTICNWETDRTAPQLPFIPRIVAFLGYNPHHTQPASLGKRVCACRRSLGLSQKELARRLGIDPSTLRGWESAKAKPSAAHINRLTAWLMEERFDLTGLRDSQE